MPVYEYDCAACGPFADLRPLSAYRDPHACPACGGDAPRALLTAPALAGMDPGRRRAAATNERSSNEPRKSSHAPGCGCCSGRGLRAPARSDPTAAKSFPAARPWMISH